MSEHRIQNDIRNDLAGQCLTFRGQVGQGWTGDVRKLPNGDILIKNPRPFSTGLPAGFSDLFALVPIVVTPDMVGRTIGVFGAVEVKQPGKQPTAIQRRFLDAVKVNGGRAGVARSVEEARAILLGRSA